MQRSLNDVFKIKLNFMGCHRIEESVERLLQLGFEVLQSAYDCVKRCLVQKPVRSINEQANVLVKLNFRWKLHCSLQFPFIGRFKIRAVPLEIPCAVQDFGRAKDSHLIISARRAAETRQPGVVPYLER